MYNGPNDRLFHDPGNWQWIEVMLAENGHTDIFERQIRPYDDEPVRCAGEPMVSSSHEIVGYYHLNKRISEAMNK